MFLKMFHNICKKEKETSKIVRTIHSFSAYNVAFLLFCLLISVPKVNKTLVDLFTITWNEIFVEYPCYFDLLKIYDAGEAFD